MFRLVTNLSIALTLWNWMSKLKFDDDANKSSSLCNLQKLSGIESGCSFTSLTVENTGNRRRRRSATLQRVWLALSAETTKPTTPAGSVLYQGRFVPFGINLAGHHAHSRCHTV